jgi:hypothetical protein
LAYLKTNYLCENESDMVRKLLLGLLWLSISVGALAQTGKGIITGKVTAGGAPLGWVNVGVPGTAYGATTGADGTFTLENVPFGTHEVRCSFTGYSSYRQTVTLSAAQPAVQLAAELKELQHALDEVVVTGTRTARKRTESPVACGRDRGPHVRDHPVGQPQGRALLPAGPARGEPIARPVITRRCA